MLQFVNLNFATFFSATCAVKVDFIIILIGETMAPIFASLCILMYYVMMRITASGKDQREAARQQCMSLFLFVTYFVFPSVSCTIFRTYSCDYDFDNGKAWLKSDYSVSCIQHRYKLVACASRACISLNEKSGHHHLLTVSHLFVSPRAHPHG